jgi:hypothetical protein
MFIARRYFPNAFQVLLAVVILLAVQVIFFHGSAFFILRYKSLNSKFEAKSVSRKYFLVFSVVIGIVLPLIAIWPNAFSQWNVIIAFVFACCAVLTVRLWPKSVDNKFLFWTPTILLATIPALSVWDLTQEIDVEHTGFFLAPANEVNHGRLMLTETFSQYGLGVIYFLVALLKVLGFGYGSLVLLTGGLAAFTSLLIFAVLTLTTRSPIYATIGTFVSAILGPLSSEGSIASYPSTGFLRFGPTWLFILLLVLALKRESPSQVWIAFSSVALAVSFVWSFESAVYSIGTFVIVGIVGPVLIGEKWLALKIVRSALIAILVLSATVVLLTWAFSGSIINLTTYAKYIKLYSIDGFGTLPIAPWSPGILMFFCGIGSLIALGVILNLNVTQPAKIRREFFPILAVTVYAVLAFTYFLGRSHTNNLTHISAPFVVMIVMWMSQLSRFWRFKGKSFPVVTLWFCFFSTSIIGLFNWTKIDHKYPNSALGLIVNSPVSPTGIFDRAKWFLSNPVLSSKFKKIDNLVADNVSQDSSVLLVVSGSLMTESLVRLDRVNPIAISNPSGDGQLTSETERILSQVSTISCGSYILIEHSENTQGGILLSIKLAVRLSHKLSTLDREGEFSLYVIDCV